MDQQVRLALDLEERKAKLSACRESKDGAAKGGIKA